MTIYALSSGIGTSGIAVVRISGPDAKQVIEKLTSGPFPAPRMATLKKVNNINRTSMIDEGIVIIYHNLFDINLYCFIKIGVS